MMRVRGDGSMCIVQNRYAVATLVFPFSLYSIWNPVIETFSLKVRGREQVEDDI